MLRVLTLESGKYGRYAVSVMKLIELIQKKEKQVEVVHVGEPQFILTYEDPAGKSERMSWLKTAFVCLVTFFGTMFSIMTFNTDVDIPKLFERISSQFTSDPRGLAILEVTYSVGIGIGVVFFFNHFGKWKITEDPTPMEVEMRAYEEQDRSDDSGDGEQKGEQFRMREIFLGMLGLCMGTTIASGVVAFIISLGIVPKVCPGLPEVPHRCVCMRNAPCWGRCLAMWFFCISEHCHWVIRDLQFTEAFPEFFLEAGWWHWVRW